MRLAGAALNQTPLDWANNLANIQLACAKAQGIGVELLLLPELCLTGYGCDDLFLSEWLPEVAAEKLLEVLPWTANLCCVVGLPVRWEGATYNCAAVLRDGQILGLVAKQFLANDGVHYEARWFRPWRAGETTEIALGPYTVPLGDLIFEHQGVKFGFEICEDAWRPDTERPACRLMPRGVQLIVNPSASHFAMSKTDFRYQLVANASRNFQCTYLYANLLGNEAGRIVYDGEILIARNGHLLQRNQLLSFKSVDLEWADVDFAQSPPVTDAIAQLPAADEYQELNYALSLALFDYMRKSRTRGFVLSLSGGADSSMCAVAVAEMVRLGVAELGEEEFRRKLYLPAATGPTTNQALVAELLMCAYQGTENSSDDTFLSAKELAESIGATFYHWTIDAEVAAYTRTVEQAIGRELTWQTDDLALQNIQARVRAPAIWLLANTRNALLLTTSNRSEAAVGYCTMDGDTAGSIAPLGGVDKDFLRRWLVWAERERGYAGLHRVNTLQPTAELRPLSDHQTDERDLMPYAVLNAIERLAFYERLAPRQVLSRLGEQYPDLPLETRRQYVRRFFTLWSRNQWKRERYAPSFHLDDYNLDPRSWLRFPILSGGYAAELAAL